MAKIGRREFLGCSAAALGAACLACGGTAHRAASVPETDKIETSIKGEKNMDGRVLVAYATKCGSTGEIAKAIAEVVAARGPAADVLLAENVKDLAGYSAVVLGSAVRFGAWLPPALDFARRFREEINGRPVALFTAHIMALGDGETDRAARQEYINPVLKEITPVSSAFFAGKSDPEKLSFLERTVGRLVGSPEGDLRDWEKIRSWAKQLALS